MNHAVGQSRSRSCPVTQRRPGTGEAMRRHCPITADTSERRRLVGQPPGRDDPDGALLAAMAHIGTGAIGIVFAFAPIAR